MKKLEKIVMLILICASTLCVNAQTEVSVDGLRYSLYGIQATVIGVASGNTSEKIIVPESICYDGLQYKVYRIGSKCFYKNNGNTGYVKEVILPNTIESISNYAFSNSNIQKVKLEEGVTQILSHAFEESGIKEIVLPKSLVKYGDNVFFGCNLLRTMIYLSEKIPENYLNNSIAPLIYVPDTIEYKVVANYIKLFPLISFENSIFNYNGSVPTTKWSSNLEGYSSEFDMPTLKSDAGNYKEIIPVSFTKGEESFTANIPYKYTIEPAKLKAIVNSTNRTYGEPNPNFTISYSGFVNGEDENVLITKPSLATTADKNSAVGTYPITISGGKAKNYTLEYEEGVLTVNKASLGIQVMDAIKVYGDENPTFTLSYSGLKNNETAPEWITAPQFTTDARKSSDAGQYPITITCEPKNYTVLTNNSGTLTIEQAPLTIKANNVSMDYCGTLPTYTYSYSGFVNDDDEKVLTSNPTMETDITQTSNVGTYVITPCGATAKNYVMTYIAGELTVKPITLTVKANNASRLYGDDNPDFELTYKGFVNNETKDVLNTEPTASTTATVKSYAGTYDISVSGGKALNYTFSYKSGQLTITSRNLNAYVGDYERAYGEDNPIFVITYEGFVNNDTEKSLNTKPSAKTNATKTSNVGTYDITLSGGYSPNYIFTYGQGKLTIVKAEQTFVWDQDLSNIEVGSQIELLAKASSGLTITYTMDSDEYAEIYKAGSKTYMECKKAGTFSIKAVQDGNDNYYSTQRINKKVIIVDEGGSAINTIQNSKVKVLSTSDGIRVTGVNSDDVIRVYTIDGALEKIVHAKGSQVEIPLHKDNMYVVKVGAKTVKLRL